MLFKEKPLIGNASDEEKTGYIKHENERAYVFVRAHTNLTAKTPYALKYAYNSSEGEVELQTAAVPTGSTRAMICVPEASIGSGNLGFVQVLGLVEDMVVPSGNYTAGHGLKIVAGAVTSTGAAADTDDEEFGVAAETGSGVVALDVYLKGREASTDDGL